MGTPLVDQQCAFVTAYVLGGGNGTQAARDAGYSEASARQQAYRLLRLPHVQDAIQREQAVTLRGRLASKALGVLEQIMDDKGAPAGARVDAAKTILDRAGLVAARVPVALDDYEKPPSEMTLAELEAVAVMLEKSLAVLQAEAHAIDVSPGGFCAHQRVLTTP